MTNRATLAVSQEAGGLLMAIDRGSAGISGGGNELHMRKVWR